MDFRDTLRNGCIAVELQGRDKRGIIEEMVGMLVTAGKIAPAIHEAVLKAVLEREATMSTGMQKGIAVPHGKTPLIEQMVTAVGVKREGVEFASMDGKPSRIFVMTVSSTLRAGPHIEFLAGICKYLARSTVRERILAARTPEEIVEAFSSPAPPA